MATSRFPAVEQTSCPRIFFSSDFFLDESEFITIFPNPEKERQEDEQRAKAKATEFEFLSGNLTNTLPADELFCQGKLLPFSDIKLNRIAFKPKSRAVDDDLAGGGTHGKTIVKEEINWFIDDGPSPRPPKCTLLWKELLRLKKQRGSSPALSTSSSSSSSKALSLSALSAERKEGIFGNNKKKKSGERTRTGMTRIRPVINVPICSQAKNTVLSPMIAMRKGRFER